MSGAQRQFLCIVLMIMCLLRGDTAAALFLPGAISTARPGDSCLHQVHCLGEPQPDPRWRSVLCLKPPALARWASSLRVPAVQPGSLYLEELRRRERRHDQMSSQTRKRVKIVQWSPQTWLGPPKEELQDWARIIWAIRMPFSQSAGKGCEEEIYWFRGYSGWVLISPFLCQSSFRFERIYIIEDSQ